MVAPHVKLRVQVLGVGKPDLPVSESSAIAPARRFGKVIVSHVFSSGQDLNKSFHAVLTRPKLGIAVFWRPRRFPDGMRDKLKSLAAENNRSLNAEIVRRLEISLAADMLDDGPDVPGHNAHPDDTALQMARALVRRLEQQKS